MLLMHCRVIDSTVSRYRARLWTYRLGLLAASCTVIIATVVIGALLADDERRKQKGCLPSPSIAPYHSSTPPGMAEAAALSTATSTSFPSVSEEKKPSMFWSFFKAKEQPSIRSTPINLEIGNHVDTVTAASTASDIVNDFVNDDSAISSWVRDYSVLKGVLGTALSGITALTGLQLWQKQSLNLLASTLVSEGGFNETFSKLYAKSIAEKDEFTRSLWNRVHNKLRMSVTYTDLSLMKRVAVVDVLALERILEEDVANLRRQASPTFPISHNRPASR